MEANAEIYLDKRPRANGECSVKIKITHNRKRKHFNTDVSLLPDEFKKVMFADRRTNPEKQIYKKLTTFLTKANKAIDQLDIFTFAKFKEAYTEKRDINKSLSYAFDKHIKRLNYQEKISTASSYDCAKKSLESFKKNLEFANITPEFLEDYENWMINKNGKSKTTVSMYLRSLRAIFNQQSIDKSLYPFGRDNGKYIIPTSRNTKKALTLDEIGKIFRYEAEPGSTEEMARDYWIFLYLCNGMNVKDFCLVKWGNIDGDVLSYKRAKTLNSRKEPKMIKVSLKPQTRDIIKRWGVQAINKDAYIFPHLNRQMTAKNQRDIIKGLTRTINKYVKRISKDVGIEKNVTTYFARHSFATVLKRSGANTAMISELLGHSNLSVTENYLDSFEKKQIQKQTDALTTGFDKAN